MKKLFTLLLLCTSLPALAYEYKYGESVAFTGKLQTMRGGWMAIVLDKPITVVPKPGDDDGIDTPETGVRMMQLAMSSPENFRQYQRLKGRMARVQCETLYHSHTAHHQTPVYCARWPGFLHRIDRRVGNKTTYAYAIEVADCCVCLAVYGTPNIFQVASLLYKNSMTHHHAVFCFPLQAT